jgi:hypothetical protein
MEAAVGTVGVYATATPRRLDVPWPRVAALAKYFILSPIRASGIAAPDNFLFVWFVRKIGSRTEYSQIFFTKLRASEN